MDHLGDTSGTEHSNLVGGEVRELRNLQRNQQLYKLQEELVYSHCVPGAETRFHGGQTRQRDYVFLVSAAWPWLPWWYSWLLKLGLEQTIQHAHVC